MGWPRSLITDYQKMPKWILQFLCDYGVALPIFFSQGQDEGFVVKGSIMTHPVNEERRGAVDFRRADAWRLSRSISRTPPQPLLTSKNLRLTW